MYRCCIFDLDGTLLNTTHALLRSTNLTLERLGFSCLTMDQIMKIVGDGYKTQMERALKLAGDEELTHYQDALRIYMEVFSENCMYQVAPYEGIPELLRFLKESRIRTAVFSNKPHGQTVRNIEGIFGMEIFDVIQGQTEEIPKKPDPTGVFEILKKLKAEPEECLYFGDTNTDMRTGANAGVDTAGVLWGFRGREELEAFHPRYLIQRPEDAIPIIQAH